MKALLLALVCFSSAYADNPQVRFTPEISAIFSTPRLSLKLDEIRKQLPPHYELVVTGGSSQEIDGKVLAYVNLEKLSHAAFPIVREGAGSIVAEIEFDEDNQPSAKHLTFEPPGALP